MEQIKYTIYKLIDPTDNKIRYVGLTFNTLKERLKSHRSEKSKSHKCYWITKLKSQGLDPIIESIEENISSYETACEREIYFIEHYKSIGCDLTNSATGGNKNKKMSEETKEKMRQSHLKRYESYKRIMSDETKNKISEKSKIRFEDPNERERLRIANKRYEDSKTEEQKLKDILIQNPKKVLQYDLEMGFISEYPSLGESARKNKLDSGNIAKCCNYKVRTVGGFIWRFEGDTNIIREDRRFDKHTKSVLQYDLNMNFIKEYKSLKLAAELTGCNSGGISACCKGKFRTSKGFIWKYK
jgi:hypothetical protein